MTFRGRTLATLLALVITPAATVEPAGNNFPDGSTTAGSIERASTARASETIAHATQCSGSLCKVPFTNVTINDHFWRTRQDTNRTVSIPYSFEMLKKAGNIKDLELAAAGAREGYEGPVFIDSDLYKAIEAASYSLATNPDAALEKQVDEIIAKIGAAQRPDGYLNTWYQVNAPNDRFTNLRDNHELYCAGHLFEAAAAHHAATGKRTLLDVAARFATLLDATFGEPPERMGYCGHEEIELALFKLSDAAGEPRFGDLARFFLEKRGSKFFAGEHRVDPAKYDGSYWQDNCAIRDHKRVVGHAVRMMYLMSGVTDLAMQSRDPKLIEMLERVWRNTTERNMYITGGIGSSAHNEGFTRDFDLPNASAYQETCASVGMVMWNHRLALLHGDSRYADVMERALYNGFLAGVSLDGRRYFYVNPLSSDGAHHRQEWYGCACCPPNVTRTLAQLGGYAYATSPGAIWVNLYMAGEARVQVGDDNLTLTLQTNYPWESKVRIAPVVDKPVTFALRLRIPGWCPGARVSVNHDEMPSPRVEKGYIVIDRTWRPGDEVELQMEMPVTQVASNAGVLENMGKLAVQRGPLVYCMEDADQETSVSAVAIPPGAGFSDSYEEHFVGGAVKLRTTGAIAAASTAWSGGLYGAAPKSRSVPVTLIPYYAWDNRTAGEMRVWIPTSPPLR
ncbi:MAG: glycoside hydrolase family 127 protein [Candidatus Sumerlaeaceae bacterium]